MTIDEQLAELLEQLGVALETSSPPTEPATPALPSIHIHHEQTGQALMADFEASLFAESDIWLFQTSRDHYGVFYRLDLADDIPQLRVFMPDDGAPLRMRCYFVQAARDTPPRQWFQSTTACEDASPWSDGPDATRQHLLFAAGEVLKRLFWSGDVETLRFSAAIDVVRLV